MAEFVYNNAKNPSIDYTPFKLNYSYHPKVSFEKNTNPCFKSKSAEKSSVELRKLITVYRNNIYYAKKFEKQAYNKRVKLRSYAPGNKIWLSSKYIKTKQNRKLKAKFLKPFWGLHLVGKQTSKLVLLK